MASCDFCGKEISKSKENKKSKILTQGNYCEECSNKDMNELFEEILDDDSPIEED